MCMHVLIDGSRLPVNLVGIVVMAGSEAAGCAVGEVERCSSVCRNFEIIVDAVAGALP